MKKITFLSMFLLFIIPGQAFSTSYDYNVAGNYVVDNNNISVSGKITISDLFEFSPRGTYHQGNAFDIINFSLNINGANLSYEFSGDNGGLYWYPVILNPTLGISLFEHAWFLDGYNGTSQESWLNSFNQIRFFNDEMQQYDPISSEFFGVLAPVICLGGAPSGAQFSTNGGQLWLTREADPVPEPATFILLGAGIAGVGFIRRRIKVQMP